MVGAFFWGGKNFTCAYHKKNPLNLKGFHQDFIILDPVFFFGGWVVEWLFSMAFVVFQGLLKEVEADVLQKKRRKPLEV